MQKSCSRAIKNYEFQSIFLSATIGGYFLFLLISRKMFAIFIPEHFTEMIQRYMFGCICLLFWRIFTHFRMNYSLHSMISRNKSIHAWKTVCITLKTNIGHRLQNSRKNPRCNVSWWNDYDRTVDGSHVQIIMLRLVIVNCKMNLCIAIHLSGIS